MILSPPGDGVTVRLPPSSPRNEFPYQSVFYGDVLEPTSASDSPSWKWNEWKQESKRRIINNFRHGSMFISMVGKNCKKMIKLCFWDFFEFLKSSIIQNYRNIYNPVIASIFWWSKCWATKATLLTCSNKQLRVCFPTMPKYQLPLQHSWWLIQIIINNKGEARTHHLTRFWEPWRYLSESFYLGKATRRIYRSHSTRDDFFAPLLTYLLWPFSNIDDEVSWKIAVPFLQKKKISFQASITGS